MSQRQISGCYGGRGRMGGEIKWGSPHLDR
jgi:hypothetical protein